MTADPAPLRPPLRTDELAALPGWAVEVVAASASTNADLAARARTGAPARTVLAAEHQTAGRGRVDRVFVTPDRAALTFSVLLRPGAPAAAWPWLPLLAGTAVRRGVARRHPGLRVGLKWPNDVLVAADGPPTGKVCGILAERVESADGPAAVLGIGLNVSTTRAELPVPTAESLATAGVPAAELDRTALLVAVLAELDRGLERWEAGDLTGLRADYTSVCDTVGRAVRVELPQDRVLHGTAVEVDAGGGLVVEGPDGRTVVGAGDVVHVRRADA
ncbi:biotin--[acetyl-CoA-carboxylase] ligase [Nocardioides sp. ChNu-153]|uniref:biotin--[acetyl-CoA-carboxylase] ligase n=1 Tax=unclassified Nocardioides TaxID=2615069 RepID=UPI002406066C|nr:MULTISPECIES: biotin--[acetyl-CoA-carboxylase] ligase [unclassified Nocardioides]MDN7120932.1 biotin--[acetyl-CoA-carboxylase] ligase [Nocardioides sp. ChNu-153]